MSFHLVQRTEGGVELVLLSPEDVSIVTDTGTGEITGYLCRVQPKVVISTPATMTPEQERDFRDRFTESLRSHHLRQG